jgi:hypothetical protein
MPFGFKIKLLKAYSEVHDQHSDMLVPSMTEVLDELKCISFEIQTPPCSFMQEFILLNDVAAYWLLYIKSML